MSLRERDTKTRLYETGLGAFLFWFFVFYLLFSGRSGRASYTNFYDVYLLVDGLSWLVCDISKSVQ